MKLSSFFAIMFLVAIFSLTSFAQTTTTPFSKSTYNPTSQYFYWNPSVDSLETEYSPSFSIAGTDTALYGAYKLNTLTGGKGYATTVTLYKSFDNVNWISVGTFATITSATATAVSISIKTHKAPFYKLKAANTKWSNVLSFGVFRQ